MGRWQAVVDSEVVAEGKTLKEVRDRVLAEGYDLRRTIFRYVKEPGEIRA